MARIGLCMIVRNEAALIERCLASALPLIDYAYVVDTGSDDDTVIVAQRFFKKHGIAHDIHCDTRRDFADSRNAAVEWMRHRSEVDYCLVLDADNVVRLENGFDIRKFKDEMLLDVYDVRLCREDAEYHGPFLFENTLGCYYRGKLYGFLVVPAQATRSKVKGFDLIVSKDHYRDPRTYLDDARQIEEVLRDETDSFMCSRYSFYLGYCYMHGGEFKRAMRAFFRGCDMAARIKSCL